MTKLEPHDLVGVSETLLVPLHYRAMESRSPGGAFKDQAGEAFHDAIDYDWSVFQGVQLQKPGIVGRTLILDREAGEFIAAHPDALVVNLGAGLDTRFHRLDNGVLRWVELDLPDVIAFREKLGEPADPRHRLLAGSALEADWAHAVKPLAGGPVLLIAEGLTPYFTEEEHRRFFGLLADHFPGATLLFQNSAASILKEFAHLSDLSKLKTRAEIRWGLEEGADVSSLTPRARFEAEYSILEGYEHLLPQELHHRITPEVLRRAGKIVRVRFE
jgi:O-methyltransferase involved in polyketide biosynthesis